MFHLLGTDDSCAVENNEESLIKYVSIITYKTSFDTRNIDNGWGSIATTYEIAIALLARL